MASKTSKSKHKRFARKRAIRTTTAMRDGMCASRRGRGLGIGK